MEKIFSPAGILARHLSKYEPRPGQQEMAEAIADLLEREQDKDGLVSAEQTCQVDCLIVEAETGLGKTLAYLVPAALSGRTMLISTNTRNLQDQILTREIPFIQQYIAPDLKAMCVKGRQNYLCLHRWQQLVNGGQQKLFPDSPKKGKKKGISLDRIQAWLDRTTFADRSELPGIAGHSPLWQKICCQSHFCLGSDCPETNRCYLNRVRREAASCHLLVVNHHLLFSDLAVRRSGFGEVLPRYESVIFDEAHHLEDVATLFFGFAFSKYQVIDLIADVEQSVREKSGEGKKILSAARALAGLTERFSSLFPKRRGRFPLAELLREEAAIGKAKDNLLAALNSLGEQLDRAKAQDQPWGHYLQRCQELAERLELITALSSDGVDEQEGRYVHWFERTEKNLTLSATPVDIADDLKTSLFDQVEHCVFTSATLSIGSNFSYFSKRLGIPEETKTYSFHSPFDYANRSLLYVPNTGFPEPNGPGYREKLHLEIHQLLLASAGRALVLFTSFQAMELAWHSLRDELDYPLLRQGTASRNQLLTDFTKETDSVLFAVASFWEGVDVPGESLSMVIIDKLPFEVPSDPVIMARINRIKAAGGNPFFEFQVPRAVIGLRQGVGRLMRRAKDRGGIAILDVRLFSKGYGGQFLQSLPPAPLTRDMRQIESFFAKTV